MRGGREAIDADFLYKVTGAVALVRFLHCVGLSRDREEKFQQLQRPQQLGDTSVSMWSTPTVRRMTKIVCTIGPSTNTKEMIWKMADRGWDECCSYEYVSRRPCIASESY
ncbi:hypothetical protein Dsin_000123 [Dipteronia sinensis]|uniref:Pyruvate kinase n=1 Tax=Dipteronia sinensis TaxID=43782 RepID=A0AAD9ZIR2_9ROSI|nr:hypothetical protein Dsin_000123 [Dipteronia sinensis]